MTSVPRAQVFVGLDKALQGTGVRSMELSMLRNKEGLRGEHEVARSILRPKLHRLTKIMSPRRCGELQKRVRDAIATDVAKLRAVAEKQRDALDARRVFHPDANARRVHTRFLADVQKKVNVRAIEERCLAALLDEESKAAEPIEDPKETLRAKRQREEELRTTMGRQPVTSDGLPNPSEDDMARLRSGFLTDDQVFDQFVTWRKAKDRLDRVTAKLENSASVWSKSGSVGALPTTPAYAASFASLGIGGDPRLVGKGLHETEAPRARRHAAPPFENSFVRGNTEADKARDRREADAAVHAALVAEEEREEQKKLERAALARRDEARRRREADAAEAKKVATPEAEARRASVSGSAAAALQPRLEKVWFALKLPTIQKLQFLQKYASVQHAPRLPRAADLWEAAADLYPRLARLRKAQARLATGELFAPVDLVALVSAPLLRGDPEPPEALATAEGADAAAGAARIAGDVWLAACVDLYASRCRDAAAAASSELGDELPAPDVFAPPVVPPAPKEAPSGS